MFFFPLTLTFFDSNWVVNAFYPYCQCNPLGVFHLISFQLEIIKITNVLVVCTNFEYPLGGSVAHLKL